MFFIDVYLQYKSELKKKRQLFGFDISESSFKLYAIINEPADKNGEK